MRRHKQTKNQLVADLGEVLTDWRDAFAMNFIEYLNNLEQNGDLKEEHLINLLEEDFEIAITLFRIILEQSKDEFKETLKAIFYDSIKGYGKTSFKSSPIEYVKSLNKLGLAQKINEMSARTYSWKDIIEERLKMGRGSAIKGQTRGKNLEDFVEIIVKDVFDKFEIRKSFIGSNGLSTAKADFCIPSKEQPSIVIEVKAYGATGSKQSDVIGDVQKIISEKRNDTYFLLITDGVTWTARLRDFERLVEFQNSGDIYRIYTQKMKHELREDLTQLKIELSID
ncbi:DpnII family type II restriction endonuclease [Algoriphagus sp. D3-2-R+10]|uniref:DpnII family type II restriction endonuclease n=1 Tax=Algoriphagus aurantiacus TaxID=3103948 RepID=UPI002B37AF75|nr:DpnII family type II restriction endonuclease [Algoriphagus sp. D3-2-R+10]MEB2776502.1 DpnII family type II restriction endonuclease [Algoriphagus sp. D3-2-R+10]